MCCLKYEQNAYEYLNSITPRVGSTVKTPDGVMTVTDANLVTGNLFVKSAEGDSIPYKIHRSQVKFSKPKKKSEEKE